MVLLTTDELAQQVKIARSTLEKMRCRGDGPRYIRPNGSAKMVRYRPEDVADWLASQPSFTSTSQEAA